jgi:glycosyltransferase involved in cell wall biosynthesis
VIESRPVVFLVDEERFSYLEAARLYVQALTAAGRPVLYELRPQARPLPTPEWTLQCTIGPLFRDVGGARNAAIVFHEWDRYPSAWVRILNQFQQVWAPSCHVFETLTASGVTTPLRLIPPPVAAISPKPKTSWEANRPFRFLSIGQPHFRKGFHLLIEGFLKAFPEPGEATLTIKCPEIPGWSLPCPHVIVDAGEVPRADLLAMYAHYDAYASASLGEGLGLPVAEAVMASLPVVANRWGGHRDLLAGEGCWELEHEAVPQVFCSAPAYFAAGQRCGYSSPEHVARSLREVVGATGAERRRRALLARDALTRAHSLEAIGALITLALSGETGTA